MVYERVHVIPSGALTLLGALVIAPVLLRKRAEKSSQSCGEWSGWDLDDIQRFFRLPRATYPSSAYTISQTHTTRSPSPAILGAVPLPLYLFTCQKNVHWIVSTPANAPFRAGIVMVCSWAICSSVSWTWWVNWTDTWECCVGLILHMCIACCLGITNSCWVCLGLPFGALFSSLLSFQSSQR